MKEGEEDEEEGARAFTASILRTVCVPLYMWEVALDSL